MGARQAAIKHWQRKVRPSFIRVMLILGCTPVPVAMEQTAVEKTKEQSLPCSCGQTKDYLLKQMNDFRSGDRHNDPQNDGCIAKKMTDAEIDAVTEYVSGM